jgi:hypothetical protein
VAPIYHNLEQHFYHGDKGIIGLSLSTKILFGLGRFQSRISSFGVKAAKAGG